MRYHAVGSSVLFLNGNRQVLSQQKFFTPSGKITNIQTRYPIPFVNIQLKSGRIGTATKAGSRKLYRIASRCIMIILCGFGHSNLMAQKVTHSDKQLNADHYTSFEKKLESLRIRRHIPSFSVGIVTNKELVWKKGFGYADIENKIVPDENTVYHLASITKTFGSIILMQQVEAGKASLEDPIATYGINLGARWGSDERIKVKHILTHTAQGNSLNIFKPGYSFRYNGDFFNRINRVIEKSAGETFGELLIENIIRPLGLKNTVPNINDSLAFGLTGYDRNAFEKNVAKPYDWKKGKLHSVKYRPFFGPAAGLMSTVSDLATYSIAIDEKRFLQADTWDQVLTPAISKKGKTFQYGLGWFIQYYKGVKVIWHAGLWDGCSALFVKIPEKKTWPLSSLLILLTLAIHRCFIF